MEELRYFTDDVRTSERFSYWREAVCDAYVQLGCESDLSGLFHGELEIKRFGEFSVSRVGGNRHDVFRRRRDIARAKEDDFLLSVQIERKARIEQHGKSAVLRPRDFALYSSTDPYQLSLSDDFRQVVLQFPKSRLLSRLPNAELLTGLRIDGQSEIGHLIVGSVLHFANSIGEQTVTTRFLFQETMLDLIATALATQEDSRFELSLPEQHILLRAKNFIQSKLSDPELDRAVVAGNVGLSIRRLSQIFERDGETIGGYIRKLRLDHIARELVDPRFASQTISEIAIKWGFNSLQHFSKAFRDRFEQSAKDYRVRNTTEFRTIYTANVESDKSDSGRGSRT